MSYPVSGVEYAKQALAGRGEPDYRALTLATLRVEVALNDLVDTLDSAERLIAADAVQRCLETVREIRRSYESKLSPEVQS